MADQTVIACSEVWGSNRFTQTSLALPGIEGWVVARPHAGAAAGGDLHYLSACGTGRITRVLLADVAGHGKAVAPLADRLRRLMQRYMNHIDPRKLAAALNHDLSRLGESGQFVTAIFVTFFSPNGRLTVCNAGHPKPAIYRASSRKWSLLDQPDADDNAQVSNLPLGVLEASGYTGRELVLDPGDIVLLYSDCLIEARRSGEQLQEEGLLEVLRGLGPVESMETASELVARLLAEIQARGYGLDDDMTAVTLRCARRAAGARMGAIIAGMWRSFPAIWMRDVPWPEWSRANILGPMFPRFYRDSRRKGSGE